MSQGIHRLRRYPLRPAHIRGSPLTNISRNLPMLRMGPSLRLWPLLVTLLLQLICLLHHCIRCGDNTAVCLIRALCHYQVDHFVCQLHI